MPVAGLGFYPTTGQNSANYMNIVRRNFTPTLVYQNLRMAKPFLRFVLEKCARERTGGFSPITQPVTGSNFGADGAYSDWTGRFTLPGISNPVVNAEFNQSLYIQPVVFTMPELALMEGQGQELVVIDIIKARLYDKYQSVLDLLSSAFLGSYGGNTLNFNGLQDGVDNGAYAATYGNITRSSNTWWSSSVYSNTNPGTYAYQSILYYLLAFMQDNNAPLPTLGVTSYGVFYSLITSFSSIETMIVQDLNNITKERGYDIQALDIGGVPHVVDPNLSAAAIYYPNMNHFWFDYNADFNFKLTEPYGLLPIGQLGFVQALTVGGQFWTDLPKASFLLGNAPSTTLP